MKRVNLNKNGITLIALIITIIVMLIIVGVTLSAVVGDNGILNQAVNGADRTNIARELELLQLAVSGSLNKDLSINGDSLRANIENGLGNNDFEFIDNGDGSYKVKINFSDRLYYIDGRGNIISPENTIEISSVEELKTFRDGVNSGNTYDGYYISLTDDITLDINEIWEPIGLYLNENANPYDETNMPFSGVFDGNGHKVEGIYIDTTDKVQGLFGLINDGTVTNVNIGENCNITGGSATAGVVGYAYNGSVVSNCSNSANINVAFGGGIVGCAYTNVSVVNCCNKGEITGEERVGGVVGHTSNFSIIDNCSNIASINGEIQIGGISGCLHGTSIIYECYNASLVFGIHSIGGVSGIISSSSIEKNYNIGNVIGQYYVGGICGFDSAKFYNMSEIINCYNLGNVEANGQNENGNSSVGGIIGMSYLRTVNCYNTGTVTGAYNNVGGIVGLNRGTIKNSYNIGNISGLANYIGGIVGNNNEFYYSLYGINCIGNIYNSYSLEGVTPNLYGTNNSIIEECSFKTSSELQGLYTILGSAFVEDNENINGGYPILAWQ